MGKTTSNQTQAAIFSHQSIEVHVTRKAIKNIYLSVRRDTGEVRMSVPFRIADNDIREIICQRIDWIMRKKGELERAPRHRTPRQLVTGERHFFFGIPYTLQIEERPGRHSISTDNGKNMFFGLAPGTDHNKRCQLLQEWYRDQLKRHIAPLITFWQKKLSVSISFWGVKRMKTRWGSCNFVSRRIWLNLSLVLYPPECLEYVLVHELTHLFERRHNVNFYRYLDTFLPDWKMREALLREMTEDCSPLESGY